MSAMPWPTTNAVDNGIFTDEHIELCGERYTQTCLRLRGVTFAQYVAAPERYDNFDRSLDPLPLNGKQQRIRKRVIDDELSGKIKRADDYYGERALRVQRAAEQLPQRDGWPMQFLHHRRRPKSFADFIPRLKR